MPRQDLAKFIRAFISNRVDYRGGLLSGLPKKNGREDQFIQNAVATDPKTRHSAQGVDQASEYRISI